MAREEAARNQADRQPAGIKKARPSAVPLSGSTASKRAILFRFKAAFSNLYPLLQPALFPIFEHLLLFYVTPLGCTRTAFWRLEILLLEPRVQDCTHIGGGILCV